MDEIELLSGILDKTGDLIAGVPADAGGRPTPCPDYDVDAMVRHLVGWVRSFEAAAQGRTFEGDPSVVELSDDPAAQFRTSAAGVVAGWRDNGFDRAVSMMGGEGQPAEIVFNMTVMEYLTHGWDLAVGSGQPVPFGDDEAEEVLRRAEATLPPQYRGEGMPFGEIVPVPDDAPAIDRLAGFMGRRPRGS
ncbi:MAG TPA: TIGR03086 family metal-binding protein [Acidimicrobiales bacterium]